ncbi:hypothetical protein EVAR_41381_1 [Eumeta japonica]|uniref:Uncharacterized protein n=1 Tax=Eumeta variegata TaxID=151549 RepID=A0A4C1X1L2_EUMVA|nr:hypothetical protein EVAR_41381_1 [Eumeta japonica]
MRSRIEWSKHHYYPTVLTEQRTERSVVTTLFGLEKAFDSIPREGFWIVLHKRGCSATLSRLLRLLHDDTPCCFAINGDHSGSYQIIYGVKQGGVLVPTPFAFLFMVVLRRSCILLLRISACAVARAAISSTRPGLEGLPKGRTE